MRTKKIDGGTATYNNSQEVKDEVFARVIKYFIDFQVDSGMDIVQSDDAIMGAPELLAAILDDVVEFDIAFDEE